MALLHKAQIVPGKAELLARWLPTRSWYTGPATAPERVASARFDDPAGEVGIETMIVRAGDGSLLHVPLTYRGAPLAGADQWLVGTTEHSVLGTRWVYDAAGDPVYAAQVAEVIRTAGREAVEEVESDGELVRREPSLRLRGSGDAAGARELTVIRVLGPVPPGATLTGAWDGDGSPAVLAVLS
ncbi:hypothetical protein QLQ12_20110 [Actinoplanes sp. NEAU-A12]|uniref:Maltokinase N-terminal cap domain-containing protein n=1 Tax=Actinoplanes sandaracinus TaxID=3045177 RepID=A0ABT6WMF9_9ACTN|nr:hypothetical protein [Actinoplanes sandaracinus]MDI6100922.1 hypothetical protein [Actinoplanes sandaracinus]